MAEFNKFEKVSFKQFLKDYRAIFGDDGISDDVVKNCWANIKLPKRATKGSAGYDFFLPFAVELYPKNDITIPTGIKANIKSGEFLAIFPRSGLGMKHYWRLGNTVGIVDEDFISADCEGHIRVKIRMETASGDPKMVGTGQAFCQGIFLKYNTTIDDDADGVRTGGFGSTDAAK